MELRKQDILLEQVFFSKEDTIIKAGDILVENGYVSQEYINGMLAREKIVSTYVGNGVAIPHGTDETKDYILKSGISVIQIPDGVSFSENSDEDKQVFIVFGIAGIADEHLAVLSKIALFCSEKENVMKLVQAKTKEEIIMLLSEHV